MPRFRACHPDSSSGVSTLDDTGYPAFDPVPFSCSPQEALTAVKAVVADFPRTKVTEEDGTYLATTFTTLVFRFTDTVQFEVDPDEQVIHFRSDSVPYAGSDLGANRKRMTRVTEMLRNGSVCLSPWMTALPLRDHALPGSSNNELEAFKRAAPFDASAQVADERNIVTTFEAPRFDD